MAERSVGLQLVGWALWEGFNLRGTSRVLPPQAGYPAPGRHVAEELQENCECPEWGEGWKPLSVLSPDPWAWPHLLSPDRSLMGRLPGIF